MTHTVVFRGARRVFAVLAFFSLGAASDVVAGEEAHGPLPVAITLDTWNAPPPPRQAAGAPADSASDKEKKDAGYTLPLPREPGSLDPMYFPALPATDTENARPNPFALYPDLPRPPARQDSPARSATTRPDQPSTSPKTDNKTGGENEALSPAKAASAAAAFPNAGTNAAGVSMAGGKDGGAAKATGERPAAVVKVTVPPPSATAPKTANNPPAKTDDSTAATMPVSVAAATAANTANPNAKAKANAKADTDASAGGEAKADASVQTAKAPGLSGKGGANDASAANGAIGTDGEGGGESVPGAVDMGAPEAEPSKKAVEEDRVLAVIGGHPLRESELTRVVMAEHGYQTFNEMLTRALLYQALADRGWSIGPREEIECLKRHLAILADGRELADPDAFLRETTGLSALQYRSRVVWPELALKKLIEADYPPDRAEIEAFYAADPERYARPESARIAHILVAPSAYLPPPPHPRAVGEAEWEQARGAVRDLARRIREGEDFGELADIFSHDPRTHGRGGDLGFLTRAELDRALAEAAFALEPGGVSAPVRTELGYHLLRVSERRAGAVPPLSEVYERVREDCLTDTFRERSRRILAVLRETAAQKGWIHDITGADAPAEK